MAEDELLGEISFLEDRGRGLGRRFFGEVQKAERLLSRFPQSGPEILPGIRKCVLRKFRHSLIYSIDDEGILILAVAHHSRHPEYWTGRIEG